MATDSPHRNHPAFVDYYVRQHSSPAFQARLESSYASVIRCMASMGRQGPFDVVEIGCGPGGLSVLWAGKGHRVVGIDISEEFIAAARRSAEERGVETSFELGRAESLPVADASADICLMPELLEHVDDWRACLAECARVTRTGGAVVLSTTNRLCPIQSEFNLPFYGWYPARLKRHFERQARTTRPELANFATHPAQHWFTIYQLGAHLRSLGFGTVLDRFDIAALDDKGFVKDALLGIVRTTAVSRFLGHVAATGTSLFAYKGR